MESKQITQKGEATEANEEEEPCLWNNDMDYVRSNHSAHQEGYLQRSRFASNNTRTKTHTPVKIPNQNVFA